MADAASDLPETAQRLRAARKAWRWTQEDLVKEVEKVRSRRGLQPIARDSISRQIKAFEKGTKPGPLWRPLLAEALQQDEHHLFGLTVDAALPRPLLVQTPVNAGTLAVILAQRAAHIRAEHPLRSRWHCQLEQSEGDFRRFASAIHPVACDI